jgi:membrane protease YdiL (CAAX protease family)
MLTSLVVGAACGAALALGLWSLRAFAPLRSLEGWQRVLVGRWSPTEAVAVAILSGIAEEALLRAVLQPVLGLWIAAGVFAIFHVVPDGRLWFWPVMALGMGLVFGVLFERFGYPACAVSHVVVNLVGLLRLRATEERSTHG